MGRTGNQNKVPGVRASLGVCRGHVRALAPPTLSGSRGACETRRGGRSPGTSDTIIHTRARRNMPCKTQSKTKHTQKSQPASSMLEVYFGESRKGTGAKTKTHFRVFRGISRCFGTWSTKLICSTACGDDPRLCTRQRHAPATRPRGRLGIGVGSGSPLFLSSEVLWREEEGQAQRGEGWEEIF